MFLRLRILLCLALAGGLSLASGPALAAPANLLIYGDSLSAGYGIALEKSWPALLEQRLTASGKRWKVVNASISGETSAGGRARLSDALASAKPKAMVLALGANDGLRGLPASQLRDNLTAMVREARKAGSRVLLVGMRLPPNYGPAYNAAFEAVFQDVAKAEKVPLLPFLLAPIAADASAFQADRLHPVAEAQPKLLEHVWPALQPLLK